jgi:hypothetical protein
MLTPARVNPVLSHPQERRLPLDGSWRFRLDPGDLGQAENWFSRPDQLTERVVVPGCWQGQGFGGDGNDLVWDFRLEARTFRATYKGTGWYGRQVSVPDDWRGGRVWLNFGGAHPSAEVWLNGQRLGENGFPFVPFGFDITEVARPGADNWLAVRVHEANRELGFACSWQGNWSGLYRGVELRGTGAAFVERLRAHADADTGVVTVRLVVGGEATRDRPLSLRLSIGREPGPTVAAGEFVAAPGAMECRLRVPSPDLWSPDAPNLYRLEAELLSGETVQDACIERFGFVKLSTAGKHFLLNDEPYYMRGSGDFLSCPETGCPDTDRGRWRRKLRVLREYGYNYVRCQSYVYGLEYYDAADEVGLLVQSEMGMLGGWGGHTQWHVYAWPPPTPGYRQALRQQWNLVVERDANHPSANLYCMSNELGAATHFPRVAWQCCHETKAIKPTALVIWTDGGLNEALPQDFVNARADQDRDTARPVVQHEFQWWSSFPDVRNMGKYSGAVRPYAAETALEAAARHGLADVLPRAAENSQRLQFAEAKGKLEACRRDNPRLAGICHFNAMDANPSPQGIIDEFYEPKVTDSATWLQTNGDTVILSSLQFDGRVLAPGDALKCAFSVSDFSPPPLRDPAIHWALKVDERVLSEGQLAHAHEPYCTCPAGEMSLTIPAVDRPAAATLEATLTEGDRAVRNQWRLWLLPGIDEPLLAVLYGRPQHTWLTALAEGQTPLPVVAGSDLPTHARPVLTEKLDETLIAFMEGGGRVLLAASEGLVRPFSAKFGFTFGHYYFTPPANYPPYEDGHDGTIVLDHPALGDFPHEGWADLQFFRMIAQSSPLDLEPLGLTDVEPLIRVIHSYPVGRSLGYLYEGRVGRGGLLVCALQLDQSWPEARYLLAQLCRYLTGDEFAPPAPLSDEALAAILAAGELA